MSTTKTRKIAAGNYRTAFGNYEIHRTVSGWWGEYQGTDGGPWTFHGEKLSEVVEAAEAHHEARMKRSFTEAARRESLDRELAKIRPAQKPRTTVRLVVEVDVEDDATVYVPEALVKNAIAWALRDPSAVDPDEYGVGSIRSHTITKEA